MSDVYSFGVVLLEILTGRRSVDKVRPPREQNLVEWARPVLNDTRKLSRIMDPRLEGQYSDVGARKAAALAYLCLSHRPRNRPTMSVVVKTLEPLQDYDDIPIGPFVYMAPAVDNESEAPTPKERKRESGHNNRNQNHNHNANNGHRHYDNEVNKESEATTPKERKRESGHHNRDGKEYERKRESSDHRRNHNHHRHNGHKHPLRSPKSDSSSQNDGQQNGGRSGGSGSSPDSTSVTSERQGNVA